VHLERGERVQTEVVAKAGETPAPMRGKSLERIGVLPGHPLAIEQHPSDVTVELYRGVDAERTLLCAISVRYFRDARGYWIPHFLIVEDALVVRAADGRWQPLNLARGGAAALVMITSSTLPNAEGFYPALEFGLTGGPLQIDSWVMK
jgi:hypothetical protein